MTLPPPHKAILRGGGHPPAAPRITRALGLLIEEINAAPPCMPGDTRPITYQLATHPRI